MKKWLCALLCAALMLVCVPFGAMAAPAADARVLDCATLVTLGDSLTAMGKWPQTVATDLNMVLVNSGIGGDTSVDAKNRFERDVTNKNPDFVLIGLGTNDFVRPTAGNLNSKVSVADFRSNLQGFIDAIKGMDAVPILITAPYVREDAYGPASNYAADGGLNAVLDQYIAVVRELASTNGIGLIDIHAACDDYAPADFLISDGVHLSALGNQVYAEKIEAYLTENFNRDPDAPTVPQPQKPSVEDGYWTKEVISHNAEDWLILKKDSVIITNEEDGAISFANTTGLWPEVHYSPRLDDSVAVPVENSFLNIDITAEATTNLIMFFNGATPTVGYDHDYIYLVPILKKADPSLRVESSGDLSGGQTVRCQIRLSDFISDDMIDEDGNILFSGLKVFIVGEAGKKVTIREFSVTKADPSTLPKEPVYEDTHNLLPTDASQISANQGKADAVINNDGTLTISRAADDTLSWPSVAVAVNKEINLAETPYLHLAMSPSGGCANGYIFYRLGNGGEESVQLSTAVNGDVYDFTSPLKTYVNLANVLGTTETVTITKITLSVYGNRGDAVTWKTLAMAKEVVETPEPLVGDVNGDGVVDLMDSISLYRITSGREAITDEQKEIADLNADGLIDMRDAFILYLQTSAL